MMFGIDDDEVIELRALQHRSSSGERSINQIELEDGTGFFLLEDGSGYILLEQ